MASILCVMAAFRQSNCRLIKPPFHVLSNCTGHFRHHSLLSRFLLLVLILILSIAAISTATKMMTGAGMEQWTKNSICTWRPCLNNISGYRPFAWVATWPVDGDGWAIPGDKGLTWGTWSTWEPSQDSVLKEIKEQIISKEIFHSPPPKGHIWYISSISLKENALLMLL